MKTYYLGVFEQKNGKNDLVRPSTILLSSSIPPKIQRLFNLFQASANPEKCHCFIHNRPLQQHFVCKNCLKTFLSGSSNPNK